MSQINQVKEATDIITVINERLPLQRSGLNYRANCPFHGEKTPSFFVNETMQRYKCFGCGESGDVFTFLEKYESMTFAESLQYLADQAGITLEKQTRNPEDDQRDKLLAVLDLAKEYYHFLLEKHSAGEVARKYLKERGITAESVKIFQIGFALDSWDGLITYLTKKKKYSITLLDEAGLVVKGKGGRYYDRFRNRVVFPLTNHRGQIVGFSGRTLEKNPESAKYINSPETKLYHKSELLFGYSQLRQAIREQQSVIVTEGELDVISSAQAHVNNVVGLKGSALTEQQAKLLERVASKVILALDTDKAGIEATKRAIGVSANRSYELRVVILPEGKDPDQLAQNKPDVWRKTVKESVSVTDFFLTVLQKQYDVSTPEGKREVMKEITPVLQSIDHAVEQDFYIKKVSKVLGVRESVVREDLRRASNRSVKRPVRANQQQSENIQPVEKLSDKLSSIEQQLLRILLLQENKIPERLSSIELEQSEDGLFKSLLTQLADFVQKKHTKDSDFTLGSWSRSIAADHQQLIMEMLANPEWEDHDAEQLGKVWQQLRQRWVKEVMQRKITTITQELNELDSVEDKSLEQEQRQQELLQEVVRLRVK